MKRTITIFVLFVLIWAGNGRAQFATTMDSSDVAGWNFTTFTDTDDSLKAGYQIFQKIDTTDAVIDSAVGAERAAIAASVDEAASSVWAGRVSDETGTGLWVFGTSPTFTTDITSPLIIGGTATTSDLSLKTTSGVGATGADMHFLVGNDGGTEAMTILNDGKVGIGTTTPSSIIHIKANIPGTVGSHPGGQIIIQNPADNVWSNAVITGYESDVSGDPDQQLWYLGSSSSSSSDIIFLNRRNSNLQLGTNGTTRMTVHSGGNIGIGTLSPPERLSVVGNIATGDTATGDVDVYHYFSTDGSWTTEYLKWDDGNSRFEISDNLYITGNYVGGNVANWNTAYSWGDHSTQNYLDEDDLGNWKVYYGNGASVFTELALGADGTYLKSTGASSAPTFATPPGGDPGSAINDSIIYGYQVYQKIDTTDAVIDSAVGAERATATLKADSALAFTHQGIKKYHTDTTSENFVFDGAYHITSAEVESMFMSKTYIDAIAGGLTAQSVKGDHVDSTAEDFVFDGAYHGTSAEAGSAYVTIWTAKDATGDSIADHWGVFTAGEDASEADIHDTTAAHWDEWVHVSGDAMTGPLTLDSGLYVGISPGNTAAIHFFEIPGADAVQVVGFLGIGDDTPDFPLEIEASYGPVQFAISESDGGPNITIGSSSGDLKFTASGGDVDFADDNVSTTGTFEAATITEGGTGVATNPDIHDSCDVLRAEMSDTARTAVGDSASLFLRLAGGTMTGNITMGDNLWLGLGSGAGRIELDDQTIDEVNILGANVGIGTATPDEKLHITDNNAALKLEDDSGNDAKFNVGNSQLCLAIDPDDLVASSDICFDIDGDEVARFHASTNFGIATMSPPERLSVVGNIATGDTATGDVDVYHYFSTDGSWTTEYLMYDDGEGRFKLSSPLLSLDTLTKSFVIQAIDSDHDIKLWKTPVAITIDSVFGQCDGGTNVIGGLDEYDFDNTDLVAVVNADWTFTTTYQAIGSFTNAGIAAKNHVKWHTTSVSGTVNFFDLTIWYHKD